MRSWDEIKKMNEARTNPEEVIKEGILKNNISAQRKIITDLLKNLNDSERLMMYEILRLSRMTLTTNNCHKKNYKETIKTLIDKL